MGLKTGFSAKLIYMRNLVGRSVMMNSGFTKGLVVGSIIGASVSMMMNSDLMKPKTRKRMMRTGRTILKRSGGIIGDVVDIFR